MIERAAVFGTAHLDSDPQRYVDWATYYTRLLAGADVDLFLFNDGPAIVRPDLCGLTLIELDPHLGRPSLLCSPGVKRSLAHGLRYLKEREYRWIAFVETDCYVLPNGREDFLSRLRQCGHGMAWCRTYQFPEASLQILNAMHPIDSLAAWYGGPSGWFAHEEFERRMATLGAGKILEGDRHEGDDGRILPGDTYVAQITLSTLRARLPHLLEGL